MPPPMCIPLIHNCNKCTLRQMLKWQASLTLAALCLLFTQDILYQSQPRMLLAEQRSVLLNENNITLPLFSHHYKKCFYLDLDVHKRNSFASRTCKLPNGITVNISQRLTCGQTATIYLTQIYDQSHQHSELFAMKYSHSSCSGMHTEYNFFKALSSANTTAINMPSIHPMIPYYRYKRHSHRYQKTCFFFMDYIPNTRTLPHFFLPKTPQSFKDIDGGIIRFILNCYDDIMNAIYHIYDELNGFHNDLHERNILVDKKNHKCYLIDFEKMFYLNEDTVYNSNGPKEYKCKKWKCSATAKHAMATNETRFQIREKYLEDGYTEEQIMDGFAKVAIFDMKYKVVSMLLHFMIQNPMLIGKQSVHVSRLNDRILKGNKDRSMEFWWCTRLKLLSYLDVDPMEDDPLYKQKFLELLKVFASDRKVMNFTCV